MKRTAQNIILLLLALSCPGWVRAQTIETLDLPEPFKYELEISGITGTNGTLFLPSERCGKIMVIDKNDLSLIKTIDLGRSMASSGFTPDEIDVVEIEGIAFYGNNLLMTDEERTAIYQYNLKTDSVFEVEVDMDLSGFTGSYGIEGIAVNDGKSLLYLLRERTKGNPSQSEIHTFEIMDDGHLLLRHKSSLFVQHKKHWRYCDLFYDVGSELLFCIKSFYKGKERTAKYMVDTLRVNGTGLLANGMIHSGGATKFIDLTKHVLNERAYYATNIEGIYKTGTQLYVVSDNGDRIGDCGHKGDRKAMLLRIQMSGF